MKRIIITILGLIISVISLAQQVKVYATNQSQLAVEFIGGNQVSYYSSNTAFEITTIDTTIIAIYAINGTTHNILRPIQDTLILQENGTAAGENFVDVVTYLESQILSVTDSTTSGIDNSTGWGAYSDTQYTEQNPLILSAGVQVNLPNNAFNKLETQLPTDISTFYDGTVITGRFGDGLNITLSFAVKPITTQVTRITTVPDIGGAIGEIEDYKHDEVFDKGNGVEQRYLKAYDAYTYDTWEANGATMKIEASHNCHIYNIRYLLTRTHKAR